MRIIKTLLMFVLLSIFSLQGMPFAGLNPESVSSEPGPASTDDFDLYIPLVSTKVTETIFGVESISYEPTTVVNLLKESGTYWVRVNPQVEQANPLFWSDVEPVKGQRNWSTASTTETELVNISNAKKEAILVIRRTPEWAREFPGYPCGPVKASEIPALAAFMKDLVQRYSAPPYNVEYYELWNEPDAAKEDVAPDDVYGCWGDQDDPYYGGGYYADVLKQVYPKVKEANPNAKVVIGGLLMAFDPAQGAQGDSSRYFEGILANGGGPYFDVVSYHTYDYYYGQLGVYQNPNWYSAWNTTGPVIAAKTQFLKDLMDDYNVSGKTLLCTEIALICSGASCSTDNETLQQTKAHYVAQAFAVSIVENIKGGIWYTLVDRWRYSGLTTLQYQKLPAFNAFRFARQEIGSGLSGTDESTNNLFVYKILTSKKGIVLVAWSKDGDNHNLSLSSTPKAIFDLYGGTKTVSNPVQITRQPVYIEMGSP